MNMISINLYLYTPLEYVILITTEFIVFFLQTYLINRDKQTTNNVI